MTEYDTAKRSVEDPAGVFRPEGKSAESNFSALGYLDRFTFTQRKNRKDIKIAQSHYAEADALFEEAKNLEADARKKKFREAAEKYKVAANNWQSSGLEQDALLMAAECLFFAEDYYRSEATYGELVKEYPRNPYLDHIDSRRFEIADYWLKFEQAKPSPFFMVNFSDYKRPWNDTGGHGKRVIEKIRLDNPTGKVGDDATMRLAMDHFEANRFEEAADAFADLRMTYPDSEHLFNAQLLEIESLIESYQGPRYSSIPITDAHKRLEQITRQFPQRSEQNREQLQKAYAKSRFAMAERIWTQAGYRRDQAANGAAKFHYQRILEDFADTPFADQAREELGKIQDAPDKPPQRFKALVWALGASNDDRPWRERMQAAQGN